MTLFWQSSGYLANPLQPNRTPAIGDEKLWDWLTDNDVALVVRAHVGDTVFVAELYERDFPRARVARAADRSLWAAVD